MGRITRLDDLPSSEVSSEEARINAHARIVRICQAGDARVLRRVSNPASIRRRLVFDDVSDVTPHAGPSKEPSKDLVLQEDKSSIKWNFDFENEIPLRGDWLWVKVGNKLSEAVQPQIVSSEETLPQTESQSDN